MLFRSDVVSTDRRPLLFHDSAFHQIGRRSSDVVWLGCQDDPHTSWFGALVPADTHY